MGFDNECILNIQSLPGEYFCPVCRTLVYPNEALQAACTHLYCKPCLAYIVATTSACPYDGYLVTEADAKPLVESNKQTAEAIEKIEVHCLYHRSGCPWKGTLSDCISHCSGCPFGNSPVVCNRCGMQIVHRQVQEHAQTCPGVQPQAQQPDTVQSAAQPAVTSSQPGGSSAITASGAASSGLGLTKDSSATAVTNVTVQGNGQPAAAPQSQVPVQTLTQEQWNQQYQQYYQQYPGYDAYQQQPQQAYGYYQQQAPQQYAHSNLVQAQQQQQTYVQQHSQAMAQQPQQQVQPQNPLVPGQAHSVQGPQHAHLNVQYHSHLQPQPQAHTQVSGQYPGHPASGGPQAIPQGPVQGHTSRPQAPQHQMLQPMQTHHLSQLSGQQHGHVPQTQAYPIPHVQPGQLQSQPWPQQPQHLALQTHLSQPQQLPPHPQYPSHPNSNFPMQSQPPSQNLQVAMQSQAYPRPHSSALPPHHTQQVQSLSQPVRPLHSMPQNIPQAQSQFPQSQNQPLSQPQAQLLVSSANPVTGYQSFPQPQLQTHMPGVSGQQRAAQVNPQHHGMAQQQNQHQLLMPNHFAVQQPLQTQMRPSLPQFPVHSLVQGLNQHSPHGQQLPRPQMPQTKAGHTQEHPAIPLQQQQVYSHLNQMQQPEISSSQPSIQAPQNPTHDQKSSHIQKEDQPSTQSVPANNTLHQEKSLPNDGTESEAPDSQYTSSPVHDLNIASVDVSISNVETSSNEIKGSGATPNDGPKDSVEGGASGISNPSPGKVSLKHDEVDDTVGEVLNISDDGRSKDAEKFENRDRSVRVPSQTVPASPSEVSASEAQGKMPPPNRMQPALVQKIPSGSSFIHDMASHRSLVVDGVSREPMATVVPIPAGNFQMRMPLASKSAPLETHMVNNLRNGLPGFNGSLARGPPSQSLPTGSHLRSHELIPQPLGVPGMLNTAPPEHFGLSMSGQATVPFVAPSSLHDRGPAQSQSLNTPDPINTGMPILAHPMASGGFPRGHGPAMQTDMTSHGILGRADSSLPHAFGAEQRAVEDQLKFPAEVSGPPVGHHYGSFMDPVRREIDRKRFEEDLKQFPRPSELDSEKPVKLGNYTTFNANHLDQISFPVGSDNASRRMEEFRPDGFAGGKEINPVSSWTSMPINPQRFFNANDDHLRGKSDSAYPEFGRPGLELGSHHLDSRQMSRSPRGEFPDILTNRFGAGAGYGLGGPTIPDGFGFQRSELLPGHLRRGSGEDIRLGHGLAPGLRELDGSTRRDMLPSYLQNADSFGQSGFRNHPPGAGLPTLENVHSVDFSRMGDRLPAEFLSGPRILDSSSFQSGPDTLDILRNRPEGFVGWCLICNVFCETDEGRNLHYQMLEHQKRAMEVVIAIKENNIRKRKLSSEERSESKFRKSAHNSRTFRS